MQTTYERQAYQFLSFYRFFSYGLAVLLTQFPQPYVTTMSDIQIYTILSVLGVYSLLKVFSPLRWREGGPMTFFILGGDFLLSILLVVYTNGVSSSFLLYSLTPVITAALLFEEKVALSLAAMAALFLSVTHLALGQFAGRFTWIMQGQLLTLLIIYTIFCFVVATVPFRTNLNIRRRIESEAIIEERRRIGREIHDSIAQSLSYLNLKTKLLSESVSSQKTQKAVSELDDIRQTVWKTYEDVREAIDQLSTDAKNLPLIPVLVGYVRKFSEQSGIRVKFDVPKAFPRLSPVADLQLLRIAQEALTNVRRHALATEVDLRLETTTQVVTMVVKDNGRGFTLLDSSGYHGLNIMKERTEGLGGTLNIFTAPGKGTEITVHLPIEKVRL